MMTATESSAFLARLAGKRSVGWVLAIIVAFAVGCGLQYGRAETLAEETHVLRRAVIALRNDAVLARAIVDVHESRYDRGRARTSEFFTGLQREFLPMLSGPTADSVEALLDVRDSAISSLARSDPVSKIVLRDLSRRYLAVVASAAVISDSMP
jgi:hypothetical protein